MSVLDVRDPECHLDGKAEGASLYAVGDLFIHE